MAAYGRDRESTAAPVSCLSMLEPRRPRAAFSTLGEFTVPTICGLSPRCHIPVLHRRQPAILGPPALRFAETSLTTCASRTTQASTGHPTTAEAEPPHHPPVC